MQLPPPIRTFLQSGPHAQLVTLDPDGLPHISVAWVGLDGDTILIGTLFDQPKLANLRRDPRVALSFLTDRMNPIGLREYLVLHGTAEVVEGGAPELLGVLAKTYLGPDVHFPPMPDPPPGFVTRITVDRWSGVGPWGDA